VEIIFLELELNYKIKMTIKGVRLE